MSAVSWQPGELVSALVQTRPGRRVRLAFTGGDEYPWSVLDAPGGSVTDGIVSDARRLTVIDFDLWPGQESEARAAELLRLAAEDSIGERHSLLTWLADQIDPRPPKPDEPTGLGAVVEDDGEEWVHFGNGCFIKSVPNANLRQKAWRDFTSAVEVLSEGVDL